MLYRGPIDPANWFGVRKGFPNLGYIQVRAGVRGREQRGLGLRSLGGSPGRGQELEGPNCPPPQNHLQILLLLVFEAIVYRRQEHHRRQHQLAPLPAQAVCIDGTRQQLDQDLLSCIKYFVNFFFYKFGLEVRLGIDPHPLPRQGSAPGCPSRPLWGLGRASATCRPTGATWGRGGRLPRVLGSPRQSWPVE